MRLAIVTQQGATASGAEYAILNLLDRLPVETHILWYFFQDGSFAEEMRQRFAVVRIVAMSTKLLHSERTQLPVSLSLGALRLVAGLMRALYRDAPDVVLTNSVKAHIIGSLASRLAGIPCVNYLHDIVEGRAGTLLKFVSRLCSTARITCSRAVQSSYLLPKTSVIHPIIELNTFQNLPSRDDAKALLGLSNVGAPLVGIVGRLAKSKGQHRFVRIAKLLLARVDVHFLIVGSPFFPPDAEYAQTIVESISQAGLESKFTILPWQTDLKPVYAVLDVACNCSDHEPFGLTSLEAFAAGVPVVCFENAGICELFEHNHGGFKIVVGDDAAFSDAIENLLTDVGRRQFSSTWARSIANSLDPEVAVQSFRNVIDNAARA